MNSDGTFKNTYLGYSLLMTGTTDMRIAFHPYGLSVCLNEKAEALVLNLKQYIKTRRKLGMGLINPPTLGSMGMGLGMKPNLI